MPGWPFCQPAIWVFSAASTGNALLIAGYAPGRAVIVGDDDIIPRRGLEELIVIVNGEVVDRAGDNSLGGVHRRGADDAGDICQLQAQRGDLGRINLHADSRLLLSTESDLRHAGNLRYTLPDDRFGVIVHLRQRQNIGMDAVDQDGIVLAGLTFL